MPSIDFMPFFYPGLDPGRQHIGAPCNQVELKPAPKRDGLLLRQGLDDVRFGDAVQCIPDKVMVGRGFEIGLQVLSDLDA